MRQPLYRKIFGTNADETLIGKAGPDQIWGHAGNDKLYGKDGDDVLFGGDGNDLLDGGTGSDTMYGGAGDDVYRVDSFGDVVSEEGVAAAVDDGGIETVESSITFTLSAFFEKLTLTGSASINATGNTLGNIIKGNDADNVLSGLDGADDLRGNGGNDTLVGGAGKDTLTGGTGSDTFVFGRTDATSTDKITDFNTAEDWIGIYATDYGLSEGHGLTNGKLAPDYFTYVSGTQKQGTVFGHGQFLYNTTSSTLMWDGDGAGTGLSGVALATFSPLNGAAVVLMADRFIIRQDLPTVTVLNATPDQQPEGKQVYFVISLSAPASADVTITYEMLDGTAQSGSDFVGTGTGTAFIPAGSVNVVVPISIIDDDAAESTESFSLNLVSAALADGRTLAIGVTPAIGYIADEAPIVVNEFSTKDMGSPDPSGLAYVPGQGLFVSDSEVDETPFLRSNNLFNVQTDGSAPVQYSLLGFTHEPTGLAFDNYTGRLYVSDDDQFKIFWVDPTNPTVKQGEFRVPVAADDPEDIAVGPNGHLFIVNGLSHSIVEVDAQGNQVGRVVLPDEITDPEALVYDAQHDLFYTGGGFSSNIWCVDRNGNIVDTIDVLSGYSNPISGTRVHVKDLEFAPSSDPNDDARVQSLYVADYGNTHTVDPNQCDDGRILEVHLGDRAPLLLV